MRERNSVSLLLIALLLTTTLTPIFIGSGSDGLISTPVPPTDYHPGFIHFNVVEENGTPAAGFMVKHMSTRIQNYPWTTYLDVNGSSDLQVRFDTLGRFKLQIHDQGSNIRYVDYHYLNPDQHLYLNITLGPAPLPFRTVTGIVTSEFTGEPIPNHLISFSGRTDYGQTVNLVNRTDSQGRYTIMVPNNTYDLCGINSPGAMNVEATGKTFFIFLDQDLYEIDLHNPILYSMKVKTRARYVVAGTGRPLTGTFNTNMEVVERGFQAYSVYETPAPGGWYNFSADRGEGTISLSPKNLPFSNLSMSISTPYIHNGTEMELEVPVDLDFIVPVKISIQNETSPLSGVHFSYYLHGTESFGWYNMNYWNTTGMDGELEAWVPKDTVNGMYMSKIGYESIRFTIDTTGPGPYEYDLEMLPADPFVPPTAVNATITVIDDTSGLPVPAAKIYGYPTYLGYSYRVDDYTNNTGVWKGQIYSGLYSYIHASSGIGYIQIQDIEIPPDQPFEITLRLKRDVFEPSSELSLYTFTFIDKNGEAVPNASVFFSSMRVSDFRSWGTPLTTNDYARSASGW